MSLSCFLLFPHTATTPRRRSRCGPSRPCSPAATCSPAPRRAPARRRPSCCRCCSCSRSAPRGRGRRACSCSRRRASSRRRSARASASTARTQKLRTARRSSAASAQQPQIDGAAPGCDILVATPGRLLDLANRGLADLSRRPPPRARRGRPHARHGLHPRHPPHHQAAAGEAAEPDVLRDLHAGHPRARRAHPRRTRRRSRSRRRTARSSASTQLAFRVAKDDKRAPARAPVRERRERRGPLAPGARLHAHQARRRIAWPQQLEHAGIRAAAIHGNKSQAARTRALADFKAGKLTALVATEVASRGLDIDELPQVVNYDLPNVPEDYVHRIGRTARAGNDGHAVSLVSEDEASLLRDIERTMRQAVPFSPTPAFARKEQAPTVQRAAPAAPARHAAAARHRSRPALPAPPPLRLGARCPASPPDSNIGEDAVVILDDPTERPSTTWKTSRSIG